MSRNFWRRVWVYNWIPVHGRWDIEVDEGVIAYDAFGCTMNGYSWCQAPQPYIYEQWWILIPDTIGTKKGSWSYLGGRINWGINPEVN